MKIHALTATAAQPGSSTPLAMTNGLGMLASIACAIHCAAMPFVIAFLPMLGLSFLADESFHKVMVVVCLLLGAFAFVPGWKRHRRWLPSGIAALGLVLIATAAFALEGECCDACESDIASQSAPVEACTDACCSSCEVASSDTASETPQVQEASLVVPLLPWITPLGGLLLVWAHLTNHHFTCRCGCCPGDKNKHGDSSTAC
ncbi:MerC domain-containing protein [Allorhodopirellula solitaria]|uniref:MerC mercury resistance protein n=1 Tax=Allorhodopirellula solitaria TaxID=2527987 RepID=A0A5C5YED6_9BACT|nr:MerC domain-containing protein [Allorhodopirellula solitaria]TWT73348.1 MerC mercury resistance protein [Allorhodopirellula solitaria]